MATKKAVKKIVKEVQPAKEYQVTVKFNDEVYTFETDNLEQSLLDLKPTILKTRIQFVIKKGDKVCDKIVSCFMGRQMFRNKLAMTVFLNRIILK